MRVALHDKVLHAVSRAVAALGVVGLPAVACVIAVRPLAGGEPEGLAALAIAAILAPLCARTILRFQRVWATPEGLEIARGRARHKVPWDRVGEPRRPWWAFNPTLRVLALEVAGEGQVLVVANRGARDVIAQFRRAAG